jgi:hypothetical protein
VNFLAGVQRLHSETLRSTAAPTSVVGASDRNQRLVNAYADAWRELQSERDWKWMRATLDAALTIGKQTYTGAELGATRFGRWRREDDTYSVYLYRPGYPNTRWEVSYWNLDDFRAQYVYLQWSNTTPVAWTFDESNQLLLGPAPNDAYQLRIEYWKEPSELAADADAPDLPDRFALLPMWRALQDIAKSDAKPEVLAKAETNYARLHGALLLDQARLPHL